ncbi:MAG: hypothetical protein ACLPPF_03440 [Rhodomicrobium sp.]
MTFQIGSWVKWKEVCPIRLGYTASDIGQVVGVHEDPVQEGEIDVVFGDGDVVHRAAGQWFEPVDAPSTQN